MQKYTRIYDYIEDYQRLLYDYYSKHVVSFLVSYWNLNREATVWDEEYIMGGSYERIGELTGMKWDKYLLIPVFFIV